MTTEKQSHDGSGQEDGDTRYRTRGVLESDCAVVLPASSAAAFHRHHPDSGVVPGRHVGYSEMDTSCADIKGAAELTKDAWTDFQLHEADPWQGRFYCATSECTAFRSRTDAPTPVVTVRSLGTEELETELGRLQMEDQDDELNEYGDT